MTAPFLRPERWTVDVLLAHAQRWRQDAQARNTRLPREECLRRARVCVLIARKLNTMRGAPAWKRWAEGARIAEGSAS